MKTPRSFAKLCLLASVTIIPFSIASAQSSTNAINTTKYESKTNRILEAITPDRVSHFSIVNGPGLNFDGNPNNFDGTEDTGGQSSWHQVSLGYNLNDTTRFVFNPRFTGSYGPSEPGEERYKLSDPVFGITTTWYKKGNFTFSGGLNTVAYVFTESNRERGLVANPGGFQSANFKLNNNWDAGLWIWARYNVYTKPNNKAKTPYFVDPYVSYTANDKLSFIAYYDYQGAIESFDEVSVDTNDSFNFLTAIKVAKNLTIQPIITLYRATDMDIASGNLNFWVSGRFY